MRVRYRFLVVFGIILILATGCSRAVQEEQSPHQLVVGMMSAVDAAPFYHALHTGLFEEAGVDVELVMFTNGQHRQTALQTGQVDGAMTDLVALITQSTGDFALRGTLSTDGLFPLLSTEAVPDSGAVSAGTMEISVTNYLLDQYFTSEHQLRKVFIQEIPARLEAVASGQLDVGIFPEPFASIGVMRDLVRTQFTDVPKESLNIVAFTESSISQNTEAITRFHRAYAKAVAALQQDPESAKDALIDSIPNLPQGARETMELPIYHDPRLPSDSFTQEIITWTEQVTGRAYPITPDDLYDPRFVRGL